MPSASEEQIQQALAEIARAAAESQGWDTDEVTWAAHVPCPTCGSPAVRDGVGITCGHCMNSEIDPNQPDKEVCDGNREHDQGGAQGLLG